MNEEIQQREFAERFGVAIETWRFHLASYWTRTTYFALFQVAAFSGLWSIVTAHHHCYTAAFLSFAACAFSVIWLVSGLRMHEYIEYWWERAAAIEREFHVTPERSLVQHYQSFSDRKGRRHRLGRYSLWIAAVPCVFLSAWLWMLIWSLTEIWQLRHP